MTGLNIFDGHTHSKHSFDGKERVEDICLAAVENGVKKLTVTDHCDLGLYEVSDWRERMKKSHADTLACKQEFADRLDLGFGIELGQSIHDPKGAAEAIAMFDDYDVVLGSIHNLRDTEDFYFLPTENLDVRTLFARYYEELCELAEQNWFDVLTHITYCYRYIPGSLEKAPVTLYEEQLRRLFKTLVQNGRALEVNTSGVYRPRGQTIMPQLWELKLYRECGGELVALGSDAHEARFIGGGIKEGQELLRQAGFCYQAVYRNRKPQMFKL